MILPSYKPCVCKQNIVELEEDQYYSVYGLELETIHLQTEQKII